jgi:pyridoxamine 5'-phosphate oxidase
MSIATTGPNTHDTSTAAPDFHAATDPYALFDQWFADAKAREINDANAMALATADPNGLPNVRMVLLNGSDGPEAGAQRGFVFYTNYESAKGQELLANSQAALLFHWKSLRRQVRLRGPVTLTSAAEADAYFASRPRGSRVGAWASAQSRALAGRAELERVVAEVTAKYGDGDIPRPPHWSGFRVMPLEMEFWHDRPFRLHQRLVFRRASAAAAWQSTALFP